MKLIDKDKIVAEIEKAIDEPAPSHDQQCPWEDGYYCGLNKAENIINTLEVKEVDLDEELRDFIMSYRNKETGYSIDTLAEHFFELGLKAQKGE